MSYSFAQNTLEEGDEKYCAVRLGFRQIDGFHWVDEDEARLKANSGVIPSWRGRFAQRMNYEADWADRIVAARKRRPFTSLEDFARDTALPKRALILLADADAFRSIGLDRRAGPVGGAAVAGRRAAAAVRSRDRARAAGRAGTTAAADAAAGAGRRRLPDHPPVAEGPSDGIFAIDVCAGSASSPAATSAIATTGSRVRCAGVVLVRQRPGSAKGVVFMTLEDETGIANIVVWPKVMEKYRKEVMGARLILVEGYIQSSPEEVTHLVAQRMFDRSHDLIGLANDALAARSAVPAGPALIEPLNDDRRDHGENSPQKIRHPRNVRILPPSRDFH